MKYYFLFFISLSIIVSCGTSRQNHGIIEKQSTYIQSETGGWEVFEVNSRGRSIREMSKNAKSKIVEELILYGYRGKININPLLTNPRALKAFEKSNTDIIEIIIKDNDCVQLYTKNVEGRIGPRSQSLNQSTFLIKVQVNTIRNIVTEYYENY
ncbi:MAG: hypothetical protein WC128_08605 [Bacteroidales bacterium]|jgi:hypothetical protein